ncbi:helix-turn-helix domain-containing protein [Arenibacter lacus]|uniref:helix-turn-helix domain-containing protein n=1 Tax=Arenibacter lacus TaxID=2608629 RepID=UPI00123DB54A|nr:helix-turn-helix domain-containing protein [Arenibacter lacus]
MKHIPVLGIDQFEQNVSLHDIYSNTIEDHLRRNEKHFNKPHKHNFFLCVLFTEGTGTHEIDFESYPIEKGSVFFLRPGQSHFWQFTSIPKGYIFFHSREFYEVQLTDIKLFQLPFYGSPNNVPLIKLNASNLHKLVSRFREINDEYSSDQLMKRLKLVSLIQLLYIDLTRLYLEDDQLKFQESVRYLVIVGELESLVEQYYLSQKSASFYAEKLHISTKHLNRVLKAVLNKTTTQLITERIILEAKRLLVHSNDSLNVISEVLGYREYAHFSKVFKNYTAITPIDFRKSYKE